MEDAGPIAWLASIAIVGVGWIGRWDVTISAGLIIAAVSTFVLDAPLGDQRLPTILVAAAVTQYRIGAAKDREENLRRYREQEEEVERLMKM